MRSASLRTGIAITAPGVARGAPEASPRAEGDAADTSRLRFADPGTGRRSDASLSGSASGTMAEFCASRAAHGRTALGTSACVGGQGQFGPFLEDALVSTGSKNQS